MKFLLQPLLGRANKVLCLVTFYTLGCGNPGLQEPSPGFETVLTPSTIQSPLEESTPDLDTPNLLTIQSRSLVDIELTFNHPLDTAQLLPSMIQTEPNVAIESLTVDPSEPNTLRLRYGENLLPKTLHITLNKLPFHGEVSLSTQTEIVPETKIAFLSSSRGTAKLSTWSLAGGKSGTDAADEVCQQEAEAAGLRGVFIAWISSSTRHAKNVLGDSPGAWLTLAPGNPIFSRGQMELFAGEILNPLHYHADGQEGSNANGYDVLTRTTFAGLRSGGTFANNYCQDWTSAAGATVEGLGHSKSIGEIWTRRNLGICSQNTLRLFCLQKGSGHGSV